MTVVAKVNCWSAEHSEMGEGTNVQLQAVVDGSEENKSFAKATPSMMVQMFISDGTDAAQFFEPGQEYYVEFKKVNNDQAGKEEALP